jgi:3-carboxy-cis,cis-muconate cycloisomerase
MKPSSTPSDRAGNELFASMFARGRVAFEVSAAAWLKAMLDAEAALARALARANLVSAEAARAVTAAARPDCFDMAELGRASGATGTPVPALVQALIRAVPEEAAGAVHLGATSQDVLDTAMMLVAKRAVPVISDDLRAAAETCALLADRHRATVMIGRTLLTQAVPITFGLKAASWLTALDRARVRLSEVLRMGLPVQLGGAAGTLAPLGEHGCDVVRFFSEELGLVEPVLPWHTLRLPVIELATALAGASAVLGKIARDVSLLAQTELAEVEESGAADAGGSSTMPHKKNAVGAVVVLGCTRRVPGLVATLLAAAEQEHERSAGAWHAEWETLSDLLRLVGSASDSARELLGGLEVNAQRMRENLDASQGMWTSEHMTTLLIPKLGRLEAYELVRDAALRARASGRPLLEALFDDPKSAAALARAGLDRNKALAAIDPLSHLGSTQAWIDRALAAHREAGAE